MALCVYIIKPVERLFLYPMIKRTTLLICVVLCVVSTTIFALEEKEPFQSGFYIGQAAGLAHLHGKRTDFIDYDDDSLDIYMTNDAKMHHTHVTANIFGGYLQRIKDTSWMLGGECNLAYNDLSHQLSRSQDISGGAGSYVVYDAKFQQRWSSDLLIKGGYVLPWSLLLYGVAGATVADFDYRIEEEDSATIQAYRTRKTTWGSVFGIGLEREWKDLRIGLELKNSKYAGKDIHLQGDEKIFSFKSSPSIFLAQFKVMYLL